VTRFAVRVMVVNMFYEDATMLPSCWHKRQPLRPCTYASGATLDGSVVCTNAFSSVVSANASLLRQVVGQCYRDRPPFITSTALRAADPPDTLAPAADLETSAVELPRFSARAVGISAHACEWEVCEAAGLNGP